MRQLRALIIRIAGVFRRNDGAMCEEIESNLQMQIEDNVRAGMSTEEARRQAIMRMGGIEQTKESFRDQRGLPLLETLLQDARYSLRVLGKSPGFTAVAVLTLALGIGATTALFSVVNRVLLQPLTYPESQRLYVIKEIVPRMAASYPVIDANLPDFLVWRQQAKSFEDIAIAESDSMILSGAGDPVRVRDTRASANFLEMLGARTAMGRWFRPEEDITGHGYSAILTDAFWRTRFNADPGIVGRPITLDGTPYTVVGVLPASFHMPGALNGFSPAVQLFVPLNGPKEYEQGLIGEFDFTAIGRLQEGVSPTQALSELNNIQAGIAREAHDDMGLKAALVPLKSEIVGPAGRGLVLLLGAVGGVLLMICVNLANLLLARVPGRLRDSGIRKALGATPARLFRQTLVESLLLTGIAGGLGMVVAYFGVSAFAKFETADIPRLSELAVDARALAFAMMATVFTAAMIGAVPAWLVSRVEVNNALASSGKSTTHSRGARNLRGMLIGVEVGTCTVLLILAGLLGRSLLNLLNLDPGFRTKNVLAVDVDLPPVAYQDGSTRDQFYRNVLDSVRALPGVQSAAWINILPLSGQGSVTGINLPGKSIAPKDEPIVNYRVASPGYFATIGIPIVGGRAFREDDHGKRRMIVSQALARKLWPGQDPVGKEAIGEWGPLQKEPSEVIGIAGDIRTRLDKPPLDIVYLVDSWVLGPPSAPMSAAFVVHTTLDLSSLVGDVRAAIHSAGPEVPIVALRPLSELVQRSVEGRRFQMSLTSSFAISALLLAGLGIFGVVAYSVEQRRREFGIRSALGATRPQLLTMVLRQGLRPVAIGLTAGIVAALLGGSLLRGLIFGITSFDPLTFVAVSMVIAVVGTISCYAPARRATRTSPMNALRYE